MTPRRNSLFPGAIVGIVYLSVGAPLQAVDAVSMKFADSTTATQTSDDGLVRVTATVEAVQIEVAEPVDVTIVVEAPEGADVEFPDAEEVENKLAGWNLLEQQRQSEIPTGDSETARLWRWKLTVETLRAEPKSIPPFEIRYRLPGEPPSPLATIATPSLKVTVESVVEASRDPRSFREIKGSLQPPTTGKSNSLPLLMSSVVVLIGVGVATALWLYRRSRRRLDPADEAKRCIVGLESEYRRGSRTAASTIVDLDQVMRTLIESSLAIPATALSRDELIQRLAERLHHFTGRDDQRLAELDRLMETSDQAKYAGKPLTAATADRFLKESLELVDQLAQRTESTSAKGAR